MPTKSSVNTQFARAVSNPNLAPIHNEQDGTEPLANLRGVLYVDTSGGPPPPPVVVPYPNGKRFTHTTSLVAQGTIYNGGPGLDLIECYGFKSGGTALRYIQFFDGLVVPPNGTVPRISIPLVGANTIFSVSAPLFYTPGSPMFGTGLVFAMSTTPDFLTLNLGITVWITSLIGIY